MIPWLKQFLFDQTAFTGLVRALFTVLGLLTATGKLPAEVAGLVPDWVGLVLVGLGSFIRAGEKNRPAGG